MKRIIHVIITILLCMPMIKAQSYYSTSKVITKPDYTYQVDVRNDGSATLYNQSNKYTYKRYENKDGSELDENILLGRVKLIENDNWTRQKCLSIVNNTFTQQEKEMLKNDKLGIRMIVDTDSGKVIEVNYWFLYNKGFGNVELSVFRAIEEDLKKNIWFTLTEEGKKLNHVLVAWMHKVE